MIMKNRNKIMLIVAKEDPTRYHGRTVKSEVGHGRKNRPRTKNWFKDV